MLELRGSWRAKRRADAPPVEGVPEMPGGLSGPARKFWDEVVPDLVEAGAAGLADTAVLIAASEVWALYRQAIAAAASNPCDPSAQGSVTTYLKLWVTLASKLGLTPADRQRLLVERAPADPDSISAFARERGR
jgi:phage terminase small subunit